MEKGKGGWEMGGICNIVNNKKIFPVLFVCSSQKKKIRGVCMRVKVISFVENGGPSLKGFLSLLVALKIFPLVYSFVHLFVGR